MLFEVTLSKHVIEKVIVMKKVYFNLNIIFSLLFTLTGESERLCVIVCDCVCLLVCLSFRSKRHEPLEPRGSGRFIL